MFPRLVMTLINQIILTRLLYLGDRKVYVIQTNQVDLSSL